MSGDFLEKEVVVVNSLNRSSGNSSNFTIDISSQLRQEVGYDSVSLLKFSCPKSYYLIDSTNDTIIVTESTTTSLVIAHGNYSFGTMQTYLTTLLQTLQYTYVVIADRSTGQFVFQVSNNSNQPIFSFSNTNSPYNILGFDQQSYQFSSNKLISPNVVNFQHTSTIQLACDLTDRVILSNIVTTVVQDFGVITYVEPSPQFASRPLNKSNVRTVNFYLIDGNTGKLINLNGLNFNFVIAFYKKNTYYSLSLTYQQLEAEAKLQEIELEKQKEVSKLI